MEKEFVPYQESLELKELGFDEPCFGTYRKDACNGNPFEYNIDFHTKVELDHNLCPKNSNYVNDWISAPTFSQAFRWFREKYKYEVSIHKLIEEDGYMASIHWEGVEDICDQVDGNTYEEAELACLKKLIEIVKQNGK